MRFYCTSTGPIGGLNCEVLLYFCTYARTYMYVNFGSLYVAVG